MILNWIQNTRAQGNRGQSSRRAIGGYSVVALAILLVVSGAAAQSIEELQVQRNLSQSKTIVYSRHVRFDPKDGLYHVQDFFTNGQIQMDATYSALNKSIKEDYQCNYRGNTKEGVYREWYENGNPSFIGRFKRGRFDGTCTEFSMDGRKEVEAIWKEGQLNGQARFWTNAEAPPLILQFRKGVTQHPRKAKYAYFAYTPTNYDVVPDRKWPLLIYLHGGSDRGTNLNQLFAAGVPDQIYRGRQFPFIVAAPQCPRLLRWTTDDWFETFYREVTAKYRVDTNRVHLTGVSLGGEGTWYLAAKYPTLFAAIAPISGFSSRTSVIDKNREQLARLPVWAFHGELDLVVPVEETRRMVGILNSDSKSTIDPATGHWVHWSVYPGVELYEWFLQHERRLQ
jgi:pimeloyl-ACP methyl ester carboxylesterase